MYSGLQDVSAERVCVVARVRPSADSTPSCLRIDKDGRTLHCGPACDNIPNTAAATTALHSVRSTPSSTAAVSLAGAFPIRPPHPPPTTPRARAVAAQSFTLDAVTGDVESSHSAELLQSLAQTCAADYLTRGRDATFLCVGERASGKTTTLFGTETEDGLCARIGSSLFDALAALTPDVGHCLGSCGDATNHAENVVDVGESSLRSTRCCVTTSCLLLQGEHVIDLLAPQERAGATENAAIPSAAAPPAHVKPSLTMDVHGEALLRNITLVRCATAVELRQCVARGRRVQAALPSSYGHVIVRVEVSVDEVEKTRGEDAAAGEVATRRVALLHLVDLASVRAAPFGSTVRPASAGSAHHPAEELEVSRADNAAVRQSLSTLREVVVGLVDGAARARPPSAASTRSRDSSAAFPAAAGAAATTAGHRATLPYKSSKLTTLLKGHLGGGCHTTVLAHVRSEAAFLADGVATLRFARQLLCIPVEPAPHLAVDPAVQVRQLQRQITALQHDVRMQTALMQHDTFPMKAAETTPAGTALMFSCASPAPAHSALEAAVADFIAGRAATLPVTSVESMNTCFDLLRRQIVERDVRLAAALADFQTAQAAAAAAAWSAGASRRFSRRSSSIAHAASASRERTRRGSGANVSSASMSDASIKERGVPVQGGAKSGNEASGAAAATAVRSTPPSPPPPPSHAAAASAGGGVASPAAVVTATEKTAAQPSQTTLLLSPSPTRVVTRGGIGFGFAAAPAATAASLAAPSTRPATPSSAAVTAPAVHAAGTLTPPAVRQAGQWLRSPVTAQVSWVVGASNTSGGAAAAEVPMATSETIPATASAAGGGGGGACGSSLHALNVSSTMPSSSASVTEVPFALPSALPLHAHPQSHHRKHRTAARHDGGGVQKTGWEGGPPQWWDSSADALRRQTMPFYSAPASPSSSPSPPQPGHTLEAHSTRTLPFAACSCALQQPPVPESAAVATPSVEAQAFLVFTTETAEGRELTQQVRDAEAVLAGIRQGREQPSQQPHQGGVGLMRDAQRIEEATEQQLARCRHSLLSAFEGWYAQAAQRRGDAVTAEEPPERTVTMTPGGAAAAVPAVQEVPEMPRADAARQRSSPTTPAKHLAWGGVDYGRAAPTRPSSALSASRAVCVPQLRLRPSSATLDMVTKVAKRKTPGGYVEMSAATAAAIYRA